jgi:hypothetical protein
VRSLARSRGNGREEILFFVEAKKRWKRKGSTKITV